MTVNNSSIQPITNKLCSNDATHTTKQWRKDPNDKTRDLCKNCYKTALAEKHKAEGRACSNDATHTTKQWYKDPNDKTRDLCKSCYNAAVAKKQKSDRTRKREELNPKSLKNAALQSVSEPPTKRKRVEEGVPPVLATSELSLVENQQPPAAEIIGLVGSYADIERFCLPSIHDSSIFLTTNALQTESTGEIPDLETTTESLSFQASAPPVRENRRSSADMGGNESDLFKVCSNDATHTAKEWRKDPNDKTRDLCRSCYETALAEKHKAEGRVCSNDATHTTRKWVKDPNNKTRDLCKNCYKTALAEKQTAEGRVCSNDASHTTKQWKKDPNDKTRDLCQSCYDTIRARKQKADRKRKQEELNPGSSKDVASQSVSEPPLKQRRLAEEVPPTSELSLVENQQPPAAEIIERAGPYADIERFCLPSIHDSSIFLTTNALQTESTGEIPDLETTESQSFQASAPPVRENRRSSADMGGNESDLFKVCSNDATHTTREWRKDPNDKTRYLCRSCYETALSEKQKAEGRVCSNDATHATKQWHKDPNNKTRDLCKNCYRTALAEKQKAEGRACSSDASHTTNEWCKDPNDKTRYLCQSCYDATRVRKHAALAEKHKAEVVVCSNDATHTTREWRKDPNDKTRDLCRSCYETALAEKHKAERRVCSNDATHTTKQWVKDPNDKTRDLCKNCYKTALAEKQTAEGRACSNNATHTTKQWHKNPNDKTRYLCKSCYDATRVRKQKADRKRKQEELNQGSSKDVASQSVSEPPLKQRRLAEEAPPTSELSLVENQQPPAAEIIERAGPYGDIEDFFLPSIHDSSIFPTTNAPQTEFIGEIPDLETTTESQSFQASAPPVRENLRSSADMGGNESDLFGYPGGWNDSSSIATTHAQLPETAYSDSYFLSDNFSSINQTSFNYLSDNNHDSL